MKRIVSIIVAMSLCYSCIIRALATDVEVQVLTEQISETSGNTEVANNLFLAMGFKCLLSDNNDEIVTRGDFLETLLNSFGVKWALEQKPIHFSDIDNNSSLCIAANVAAKLGIISEGYAFYPNEPILYQEALKMLVCAGGNGEFAQMRGSYPLGYYTCAETLKITKGIMLNLEDELTTADAKQLLANFYKSNVQVISSMDEVSPGRKFYYDEKCFLTTYYDWYEVKGIVTANYSTGLYSVDDATIKGHIKIDDIDYICDDRIYLGSKIEGFACDTDDGSVLKQYTVEENSVFVVPAEYEPELNDRQILYYPTDKKTKHVTLEPFYTVIYNGRCYNEFKPEDIKIKNGKIVLVDSNKNSHYDVVIISSAEFIYCDIINKTNSILKDSSTGRILDFSDTTKITFYDGEREVLTTSLAANSVFEVYTSIDGEYSEAYLLNTSLTGIITGATDDGLIIDDIEYKYTDYFENRYYPNITMGTSHTFILSNNNKLVIIENREPSNAMLGFAYKVMIDDTIDDETAWARIFTEKGERIVVPFANNVIVCGINTYGDNGKAYKKASDIVALFANYDDGTIMRYYTNNDGYITKVWLPIDCVSKEDSIYNADKDGTNIIKSYKLDGVSSSSKIVYKATGIFPPHFSIGTDTKIFIVDTTEGVSESSKYKMGSLSSFNNDAQLVAGTVHAYNVSKSLKAGVLVVVGPTDPTIEEEGSLGGVIESVTRCINANEELALKIVVGWKNEYITLYLPEDHLRYSEALNKKDKTDLDVGDYILYTKDSENNILSYRKDFDYSERKLGTPSANDNVNVAMAYYYGILGSLEGVSFSVDLKAATTPVNLGAFPVVYEDDKFIWFIDTKRHSARYVPFNQFKSYCDQDYEILIRERYASMFQIVIYEKNDD